MAEEGTLGISRAREVEVEDATDATKEALQRRMEQARDSISNTVTEIKENVSQQYETVKEALDWREHFKKAPVAWSVGAAGVGFFVGYGVAACIAGDGEDRVHYSNTASRSLTSNPYVSQRVGGELISDTHTQSNGNDDGPGMLERFKETSAYERLSKEAGTIGDRLVEELSSTAQTVVLPLLLNKIRQWIGVDLSDKSASNAPSKGSHQGGGYIEAT
ncbi:MAG TPA: hypothetical protein VMS31_15170 [Pyrinomonadaceae bacterium]|nr:hypothetical protein [Pyrinomonadaceae bacterium]